MFGISGLELLFIAAFVLIIFGPDKLPELARTLSRAVNMFKSAQQDMERVIRAEMFTGESASPIAPEGTGTASAATTSAASVWSATSEDEDDDEEEDEE